MNFFLGEWLVKRQQRYRHSVRCPLCSVKPACYSGGSYVLETSRSSGQVAQLVEHVTENHGVAGSIPALGTNRINGLRSSSLTASERVATNWQPPAHARLAMVHQKVELGERAPHELKSHGKIGPASLEHAGPRVVDLEVLARIGRLAGRRQVRTNDSEPV
jgi:hypothetical protein